MRTKYFSTAAILLALGSVFLSSTAFAHGMSEAEKQAIIEGGNWSYLWLGTTHMLSGYDHLAFIFGIVFFLRGFMDIAKYMTAFTLGHSVTLIWATYQGIQVNYYLIDAVIALSVCYIAFSNLDGFRKLLKLPAPNMLLMITGLGLIHGFGLSTRLQELPLDAENLLLNIVTFNLGIELGQIIALAVMLVLLRVWRDRASFQPFARLANASLILWGAMLFLMQMHDYTHAGEPETAVVVSEPVALGDQPWQDSIEITIPARGQKEYKLQVGNAETFTYRWQSGEMPLYFDFHGEPAGDTTGFFKSYKTGIDAQAEGSVTTPFAGTHGWYWKNDNNSAVTIRLQIKGSYSLM